MQVAKSKRVRKAGKIATKLAKRAAPKVSPEGIFDELQQLLSAYSPPFKACAGELRGRRDFHLIVPKPVSIRGAYGGQPTNLLVADLMMQTASSASTLCRFT